MSDLAPSSEKIAKEVKPVGGWLVALGINILFSSWAMLFTGGALRATAVVGTDGQLPAPGQP